MVAVRENGKCMHWHEICNKVKNSVRIRSDYGAGTPSRALFYVPF